MSGFGFTPLMRTGGASDIATFGTGGDYADMDAVLSAGLAAGTPVECLDTGAAFVTDSNGIPLRSWVSRKGAVVRVAYAAGHETEDADLTGQGWDTVTNVDYSTAAAGYLTLDSTSTASLISATHTGSSGDYYYICGLIQLLSFSAGANATRIPGFGVGDGLSTRYLNFAETTSDDYMATSASDNLIVTEESVSSELTWVEYITAGDGRGYGYAGLQGRPAVVSKGGGFGTSKLLRVQAAATNTEKAVVRIKQVHAYQIEV